MAAMALRSSRTKAASAVPQLTAALQDQNDSVRYFAADALGAIGTPAVAAIPALLGRLETKDERGFVFASITNALGNFGSEARTALPTLERIAAERQSSSAERAVL